MSASQWAEEQQERELAAWGRFVARLDLAASAASSLFWIALRYSRLKD